jgi:hypothetical protein
MTSPIDWVNPLGMRTHLGRNCNRWEVVGICSVEQLKTGSENSNDHLGSRNRSQTCGIDSCQHSIVISYVALTIFGFTCGGIDHKMIEVLSHYARILRVHGSVQTPVCLVSIETLKRRFLTQDLVVYVRCTMIGNLIIR